MSSFILIDFNFILNIITCIFVLLVVILTITKLYNSLTKGKCKSKARLDGKVALITGGNSGIGLETAKDLAKRGAKVIIASRDVYKSAKVVDDIIAATGNKNVEQRYLDLAKLTSVRKFAEEFNQSFDRLDILVNNSGILGGTKYKLTEDGINIVAQVNHFGPFLLTNLLLDKIIKSQPSRIVIVSSGAYRHAKLDLEDLKCQIKPSWYKIYPITKLLNIIWAKALAKRVPDGVIVNSLHPGLVSTEIFNWFSPNINKIIIGLIGSIFKTAEEGAQTSIYLAVSEEVEHISGRYFEDCQLHEDPKDAKNDDLVNKVWEKSLLITK